MKKWDASRKELVSGWDFGRWAGMIVRRIGREPGIWQPYHQAVMRTDLNSEQVLVYVLEAMRIPYSIYSSPSMLLFGG